MNQFSRLLFEARKRAGLTQKELAEKIGVHDTYISKLESGKESPPSRRVAEKIADTFGMSNKPVTIYVSPEDKGSLERFIFFLEAYVAGAEDVQEIKRDDIEDNEASRQILPTASGASPRAGSGTGGRLSAILDPPTLGAVIDQIVDESPFTPAQKRLAERLILENARTICEVLAKEPDGEKR